MIVYGKSLKPDVQQRIESGFSRLKVIVYGRKGVDNIEKISPLSVVSGGGSLEVPSYKNSGQQLAVSG